MVVFLHVVVALASVALATLSFFSPSKARFIITYSLIAGTLASGVYLVWLMPSKMLHVCTAGLIYTVVTGAIMLAARWRLAKLQKGNANL